MGEPSACDIILGILNLCQCCCLTIQCCDTIDRWCDERNHDEDRAPIAVTSATHTGISSPVTQIPARTYQPASVYAAPYPAQTTSNVTVQMPMPMPAVQPPMPGLQPHMAPYPPMPQPGMAAENLPPPSYDAAMATSGPTYEKQMPYNPNFSQ